MKRLYAAVLITGLGCSDSSSSSGWTTQVDTLPNGIITVTSSAPTDATPTWILEEDLRIGSVNEGGAGSFGQIRGIAVGESGKIAVLDAQAQEIRVFDANGEHVATHGRKGEGPGEYTGAFGLMTSSLGLLYVPDHSNARMSVVDMEEGFITSYPLTFMRYGFIWDGAMRDDDHVVLPSMALQSRRDLLRIYSPEMVQVDSILLPEEPVSSSEDPPGAYVWQAPSGLPRGVAQVPFYPAGASVLDHAGDMWVSPRHLPEFRVAHIRPPADTLLMVTVDVPPVPVTTAERDSAFDSILDALSQYGVKSLDRSKIPDVKPAVLSLFEAEEGDLWVQTSSPDSLQRYYVLRRDGTVKGTVATSLRIFRWVHPIVRGEYVYAVVTDDLGVHYVVRGRLERSETADS